MTTPTPYSAFPGALWPAVPQPAGGALLAILGQLEQSQFVAPEQLVRVRRPQLEALLDHSEAALPFWQARLQEVGLDRASRGNAALDQRVWDERWARLPLLTRPDVQAEGEGLRISALPKGHGDIGETVTSGSSGRPVRIYRSTLDYLYLQAFQLREHVWRGRDLSGTFLSIFRDERREHLDESAHLRRMDDWGPPVSVVWPSGPSVLLDYRAPIDTLIETICELAPDYLSTFPSLLLEILRRVRETGKRLPPLREAIGVGEATSPELTELCRTLWKAPLACTYTAYEAGAIAYRCREEERWHLQSEKSVIEVLDEDGGPCAPGETGRVIVTPLHNFAMPLLRYEIGDLATVGAGDCACGRKLPTLDDIPGRARDLLMLENGDLRPPYYGHGAVMQVRAIRQHQVVQTALGQISFRLVVARPLSEDEERHVITAASEALGGGFRVRLEYVDEIVRGPAGKFAEFERQF